MKFHTQKWTYFVALLSRSMCDYAVVEGRPALWCQLRFLTVDSYKNHSYCKHLQFILCFLLGSSPASELYMPTFRNTLSVPSS